MRAGRAGSPGLGPGRRSGPLSMRTPAIHYTSRSILQVLLDSVLLIAAENLFAPLRTQQSQKPIAGAKSHARVAPLLQRKALPHT